MSFIFDKLALLQADAGNPAIEAAGGQPVSGTGNPLHTILLFGGMIGLFYFLLIRPQSKARKALEVKLSKLQSGDEVLLTSGFYATVDRVDGNFLFLKIGGNVVKSRRSAVAALASEADTK